jgi:hypothetical protein
VCAGSGIFAALSCAYICSLLDKSKLLQSLPDWFYSVSNIFTAMISIDGLRGFTAIDSRPRIQ